MRRFNTKLRKQDEAPDDEFALPGYHDNQPLLFPYQLTEDSEDSGVTERMGNFFRGNGKYVVIALIAIAFAAFVAYALITEDSNYKPAKPEQLTPISRELFGAVPPVKVDQIFNEDRIEEMERGKGYVQPLIKTYHNREVSRVDFTIEPSKNRDEIKTLARQDYVAQRVREFSQALNQFSKYEPTAIDARVFFDDTSGVTDVESRLLGQMQRDFGWRRRIDAGDGMSIELRKLSLVESTDQFVISIEKGAKSSAELDKGLQWLTSNPQNKPNSPLATPIFHVLKQTGSKHVIFISDFMENSPLGNFYKNPPKEEEYESIAEELSKDESIPDLHGYTIDLYVVLRDDKEKVHAARKFYEYLFKRQGAEVFSHFSG